jgi:hypothetical protein
MKNQFLSALALLIISTSYVQGMRRVSPPRGAESRRPAEHHEQRFERTFHPERRAMLVPIARPVQRRAVPAVHTISLLPRPAGVSVKPTRVQVTRAVAPAPRAVVTRMRSIPALSYVPAPSAPVAPLNGDLQGPVGNAESTATPTAEPETTPAPASESQPATSVEATQPQETPSAPEAAAGATEAPVAEGAPVAAAA